MENLIQKDVGEQIYFGKRIVIQYNLRRKNTRCGCSATLDSLDYICYHISLRWLLRFQSKHKNFSSKSCGWVQISFLWEHHYGFIKPSPDFWTRQIQYSMTQKSLNLISCSAVIGRLICGGCLIVIRGWGYEIFCCSTHIETISWWRCLLEQLQQLLENLFLSAKVLSFDL